MASISSDVYVHLIRTVYGDSKGFEVKVGMHQGSALSPLKSNVTESIQQLHENCI